MDWQSLEPRCCSRLPSQASRTLTSVVSLFADSVGFRQPGEELGVNLANGRDAEVMHVIPRRERFYLAEAGMIKSAGEDEMTVEPAVSRVNCAKDIRTWNAMRVFSGSRITGPSASIAWRTASNNVRICCGRPEKWRSRMWSPQVCV